MKSTKPFSIQDVARDQIETTKQVYMLSPERMFSEFNGEQENVKNYNNRQLLEMLQNADDAALEAKGEKKVLIKLLGDKLIIANTGYQFSEDGLKSIFHSHLSPKEAQEKQIGKKGLGFRSILSWADKVIIKSHDLSVAFSREHSRKILEELLLNAKFEKAFKKLNRKNIQAPISTLVCPDIENAFIIPFEEMESYDTVIQIDLQDKEAIKEVKKQIGHDLDAEVLLFLNSIQKIEIDIDGNRLSYLKEIISNQCIKIISIHSDKIQKSAWNIHSISGRFDNIDKPYQLSIAWQDDFKVCKNVIYAYFRTKVQFESKGILHGSFELNADRNEIIEDQEGYNKRLLTLLPELIAQVAEIIASKESEQVNYKPISFMNIDFQSLSNMIGVDFKSELMDLAKTRKIFPTIANRYISWDDNDRPVYYDEKEFAEYLTPKDFTDLLICCDDNDIKEMIMRLKPTTYNINHIINDVAQKKEQLTTEEYAKLIYLIHNYINEETDIDENNLFYGKDKDLLSFNKPIFLPNTDATYNLPIALGVQIIDNELARELIAITDRDEVNSLVASLEKYKLKRYDFTDVVETLITHYSQENVPTDSIIELNQYLFAIYLSEKNVTSQWEGTQVFLIDKTGNKRLANELYFGREYGNYLVDKIYSYDRSKILAPSKRFRIEDKDEKFWKKYLEWLGVAYLPRKIAEHGENKYAEYVMKNYDFKNLIGDCYFKNYQEFEIALNYYSPINITSIDDIDNILKNNTCETLLNLIVKDDSLLSALKNETEPKENSISFYFRNKRGARQIYGTRMKSYIKWKFENSEWLNTESGDKCKPSKCTTAAYINEDFCGLLEKPKIDYEKLKKENISKDEVDYLLNIVGVHKTINTLSTEMLYSILIKLPEIDPEGKKAKTIYNHLSANYDETDKLDKTDSLYIEFHQTGSVFCSNGTYVPVEDAFYVNDKRYGETVTKQFNTIVIDTRRGKGKIKKLFCVQALDNIKLSLVGEPLYHMLNPIFEIELELFKPYVYALRKDVDGGSEKTVIKDTRFKLVNELKIKLMKDNQPFVFDLNDYEYFYLKERNIVYIKCHKYFDNISLLKESINFCSTIAEAFSAILDVDVQRQLVRELFSKSASDRDDLLRLENDDSNLEKLTEARSKLGIICNPKFEFWKSYAKCFNGKTLKISGETDDDLLKILQIRFPKYRIIIENVIEEINYQDINEEGSSELIFKLFIESGIYIKDFNKYHYPSININKLHAIKFENAVKRNEEKFKSIYYKKCINNSELKSGFIDTISAYNSFDSETSDFIDVNFDAEADLIKLVCDKYNINLLEDYEQINLDEINNKNQVNLLQLGIIKERAVLSRFLKEDPIAQSLLYFDDQINAIEERLRKWLGQDTANGDNDLPLKHNRILFGGQPIFYNDLTDLKNQIDTMLENIDLRNINCVNIKISKTDTANKKNVGGNNKNKSRKPKIPKEDLGFLGEYLVYRHLMETVEAKESVKWVSEYARECGINFAGRDGLGYDMEYMPNNAKYLRYVEVKVVGWDNAFHISSNEVKCGEEYKDRYEIFLVRDINSLTNTKIDKIPGLFNYYKGKSFTDNDLFSVINDNYIIKFKKIE